MLYKEEPWLHTPHVRIIDMSVSGTSSSGTSTLAPEDDNTAEVSTDGSEDGHSTEVEYYGRSPTFEDPQRLIRESLQEHITLNRDTIFGIKDIETRRHLLSLQEFGIFTAELQRGSRSIVQYSGKEPHWREQEQLPVFKFLIHERFQIPEALFISRDFIRNLRYDNRITVYDEDFIGISSNIQHPSATMFEQYSTSSGRAVKSRLTGDDIQWGYWGLDPDLFRVFTKVYVAGQTWYDGLDLPEIVHTVASEHLDRDCDIDLIAEAIHTVKLEETRQQKHKIRRKQRNTNRAIRRENSDSSWTSSQMAIPFSTGNDSITTTG